MKSGNIRTRLDKDIAKDVGNIVAETGWSESNTVCILVRAGLLAATGNPTAAARGVTVDAIRKMIEGARALGTARGGRQVRLF